MLHKLHDNLLLLCADTQNTIWAIKENKIQPPGTAMKRISAAAVVFVIGISTVTIAFGANGSLDIFKQAGSIINELYLGILGISTAMFALCFLIGCLVAQTCSNTQDSAKAMRFVKKAFLIWILINSISLIIKLGNSLTEGGRQEDLSKL